MAEVESACWEREQTQLRLQQSVQGGLYGNEESWQDQEESSCEEEESRQEEVVNTLSEAIH